MKTLAVANMKGGVGKTSVAVHLATGLAKEKKVLLVDLDPQGNSTEWLLGLKGLEGDVGTADVLRGEKLDETYVTKVGENLSLLCCTEDMENVEQMLAAQVGGQTVLRRVLRALRKSPWEYVLVDCPPMKGFTVLNGLSAADGVVAPVSGSVLALSGIRQLEKTVTQVRERLEVPTRMLGYILFAADSREALPGQMREQIQRRWPGRLFKAEIRVSTAGKALPDYQETAWAGNDPRGEEDYSRLLKETLRRLERMDEQEAA